jgi:carbon starvation protein
VINPPLKLPAFETAWAAGDGPNFPGTIFPFLFITLMCGAISGFHALVSSGTTPKMVDKETDIRLIGYGAMLVEGLVGVVAIIAACTLSPSDYYGIQIPLDKQAAYAERVEKISLVQGHLGHTEVVDTLAITEQKVGENLRGRTGGAVTLAVGMSNIFAGFSVFEKMIGYWYHFAIMFEALFILTTIDTGTRIGRFLVQETFGKIKPSLGRVDWWPGAIAATAIIVMGWAYLLLSGDIGTIWPMFGIANQLLAIVALCVVTTYLVNTGKGKYVLVTLGPLAFCISTTLTAGVQLVMRFYNQGMRLNTIVTTIMLLCVVIVLLDSIRVWLKVRRNGGVSPLPAAGN